jgi:transposase
MNKRRTFTAKFKTKVVLEALSERYTINELAQRHDLHPNQISKWKQEFLASADSVFEKGGSKKQDKSQDQEKLYKIIGQQKVEIDFLKDALS